MRLSKFLAVGIATAGLILIMAAPSDAQQPSTTQKLKSPALMNVKPAIKQGGPTVRDHRTTSQPAANVRDHRKSSQGIVSATGSGIKKGAKKVAGEAIAPVRGVVNTSAKAGSGVKDLATGRPIKGAKKLAGAAADAAVAPVRSAVNAGSKVVGGAKKVRGAVKSLGKKLNPFD